VKVLANSALTQESSILFKTAFLQKTTKIGGILKPILVIFEKSESAAGKHNNSLA